MSVQGSRKGEMLWNLEVRGQFLEAEAHSCLEKGGGWLCLGILEVASVQSWGHQGTDVGEPRVHESSRWSR